MHNHTNEETHKFYMSLALKLAEEGRYSVSPNPMVGCVIVRDKEIVGEGYHHHAGGPHAEIVALNNAGDKAKNATMYVTLEPCNHYGRTPPCVERVIAAGIKTIYIAQTDPNPHVKGGGAAQLKKAGIDVHTGLLVKEAKKLNEIFTYFVTKNRPFVIAKWAMSLDGQTITHPHDSRILSSPASHQHAHTQRHAVDAILIGAETARRDNPSLTVRYVSPPIIKHPLRVILSSRGALPCSLHLFDPSLPGQTLVVTTDLCDPAWFEMMQKQITETKQNNLEIIKLPKDETGFISLRALLTLLKEKNVTSLLVEGGKRTTARFFLANLVDKIEVYLCPFIISELEKKCPVNQLDIKNIGIDYLMTGNVEGESYV